MPEARNYQVRINNRSTDMVGVLCTRTGLPVQLDPESGRFTMEEARNWIVRMGDRSIYTIERIPAPIIFRRQPCGTGIYHVHDRATNVHIGNVEHQNLNRNWGGPSYWRSWTRNEPVSTTRFLTRREAGQDVYDRWQASLTDWDLPPRQTAPVAPTPPPDPVCPDCHEDHLSPVLGETPICPESNNAYYVCSHCGEVTQAVVYYNSWHSRNIATVDHWSPSDEPMCGSCYERDTDECSDCCEVVWRDDMRRGMCRSCADYNDEQEEGDESTGADVIYCRTCNTNNDYFDEITEEFVCQHVANERIAMKVPVLAPA